MGELINLLNVQPQFYDRPPCHMDSTCGIAHCDGTRDSGLCSVGYEADYHWTFVRPVAV
jgi:hypothetical protein